MYRCYSALEQKTNEQTGLSSTPSVHVQSKSSKAASGGVGGVIGGATAALIFHPLELIKTRCQADSGGRRLSILQHCKNIYKVDGVKGFWAGVTPNIVGNCSAWGLYFYAYNYTMSMVEKAHESKGIPLSIGAQTLAAFGSGVAVLAVTNPLFVVKTRMCLQTSHLGERAGVASGTAMETRYTGLFQALSTIIKKEGVSGLWKGYSMGILGTFQASLQMVIYERLKSFFRKTQGIGKDGDIHASVISVITVFSKVTASAIMYPCQVVKTRLQDIRVGVPQHRTARAAVKHVLNTEGLIGFYRGLSMNILRSLPNAVFVFVVYEEVMKFWKKHDPFKAE